MNNNNSNANHTSLKTLDMVYTAISAALIAVCSWISIPTTVPFTMQTFAIFLTVCLLGGRRGTLAVLIYILLGAVGLPVFSGFRGGAGVLMGTTGGYIIGFLFSALAMWGIERIAVRKNAARPSSDQSHPIHALRDLNAQIQILIMIAANLICYTFGTAWYMFVYLRSTGSVGLITVLGWCVFPFIVPDLIKIVLACLLTSRLKRFIK